MSAQPDIPPPYPPTPFWSRSTSCDRELFSLRQQQGAGALFCLPSSLSPVVCLSGSCCPFQRSSTSRPCHFRGAALKLGQAVLSLKFPTDTVLSIPKWFSRPGQSLRKPEEPWSCHGNRQPRKARRTTSLNWLPGEGGGCPVLEPGARPECVVHTE